MKKVFLMIFSTVLAFSQFGCGGNTPANNSSNVQTPSVTPTATNQNANVANANPVVKQEDVPVPTFTDAGTAFTEGNKYLDADETEKSIEAYKQAVKLNPDLAEAYFKLGIAYALLEDAKPTIPGETTEPEKNTKKSKKVNTKKIGKIVLKQTDSVKAFEEAVKAYKKILAKNPKDDLAQYNLGRSLSKLSADEDAVKALREAIKLKSDDSEYQRELGATLNKLAKYDEAIKVLKKAQTLDPDNSQIEGLLEKAEAGKKRVDFGKSKNDEDKPGDISNNGSGTKQNGGKSNKDAVDSTPRDKREPPPKVETNDVKVKPTIKPKP